MKSTAEFNDEGLTLRLGFSAALLGLTGRHLHVAKEEIHAVSRLSSSRARRLLRWRVAGTAVPGWWLMGWFSRSTRDGRWAWVWITPKRELVAVETSRKRRSLIIIPYDWFADTTSIDVAVAPTGT